MHMRRHRLPVAALAVLALLAVLAAGCGQPPLYGPPPPGAPPGRRGPASLQRFRQVETGPLARACRAGMAAFARDSRNRRIPPAVLAADAFGVADDFAAWLQAMRRVPVPAGYAAARHRLLRGLALLRRGYLDTGEGLAAGEPALIRRGRAEMRAGARLSGRPAADVSL
jgi:predicted small lipoprotein YifL